MPGRDDPYHDAISTTSKVMIWKHNRRSYLTLESPTQLSISTAYTRRLPPPCPFLESALQYLQRDDMTGFD